MFPFDQFVNQNPPQTSNMPIFDPTNSQKLDGFLDQLLSKENQVKCTYHHQEEIQCFCLNSLCKRHLVCTECLLEGHHEGHEVKKLDKLSDAWLDMLKSSEIKLKYYKESFELSQRKLEGVSQTVFNGIENRKIEISQAFKILMENLMKKQKEIFDFLDKQKSVNELKQKETFERLTLSIKICEEGLEKITYSENYNNLSMLDLSNNFLKINEIVQKVENLNKEELQKNNKEISYNNEFIRYHYDKWLSNLKIFDKVIIPTSLSLSERIMDLNALNINNIDKRSSKNDKIDNSVELPYKETISFGEERSLHYKDLKESSEFDTGKKSNFFENKEKFITKKKFQEKYTQLLEIFKPGLARSKINFYSNSDHLKGNLSIYHTPKRNHEFDENRTENHHINNSNSSEGKFLYSLENQKLKYVSSAKKLI